MQDHRSNGVRASAKKVRLTWSCSVMTLSISHNIYERLLADFCVTRWMYSCQESKRGHIITAIWHFHARVQKLETLVWIDIQQRSQQSKPAKRETHKCLSHRTSNTHCFWQQLGAITLHSRTLFKNPPSHMSNNLTANLYCNRNDYPELNALPQINTPNWSHLGCQQSVHLSLCSWIDYAYLDTHHQFSLFLPISIRNFDLSTYNALVLTHQPALQINICTYTRISCISVRLSFVALPDQEMPEPSWA